MHFVDLHTHKKNKTNHISIYNALDINEIPESKENFHVSAGLHPWFIKSELWQNNLNEYEKVISGKNIFAIGECGIDMTINIKTDIQKIIFNEHLLWAAKYNKTVIIHCVKAFNEVIAIKKKHNINQPCIIHGFNNNINIARQLINGGFYISFGAALLNNGSNASNAIKQIPVDRIFLETDDSDVSISDIYLQAAAALKKDIEELQKMIYNNFIKVFNLG